MVKTDFFQLIVSLSALLVQTTTALYTGSASWLGTSSSSNSSPTPNYKDHLPIIYVIVGINGTPHVRAIVDYNDTCPSSMHEEDVEINLNEIQLNERAMGNPINDNKMPYKFPVKVCELIAVTESHKKLLEKGLLSLNWKGKSYQVPRVTSNPQRFMFISDTGLRIKPTNLGLGNIATGEAPCNASTVYGLHQCPFNFTQQDLNQPQTGNFQGLDEWYFKQLVDDAASKDVDVIMHLGDYLYRQGPCPINNTDILDKETKDCSAINFPEHATEEEIAEDTIMNYIPGEYGDNWWGWWGDFFWPFLKLLKETPLVALRGNHEVCARGGYGYFMFLSPVEMEDYCLGNVPPYSIKFQHEQFLVMDDSIIEELYGGNDHFLPGECPPAPNTGSIVPIEQNRHNDTNDQDIQEHLDLFTRNFKKIEQMSVEAEVNFYLGHRPLFAIGCNNGSVVTVDWTLQQSLGPTTLDRISATFHGHMHWLQVMEFENNSLPPLILAGNGGTKMIRNYINQQSIPSIDLHIHKQDYTIAGKVKKGFTLTQFGYSIMERNNAGAYQVNFHVLGDESQVKPIDYSVSIAKGLRQHQNTEMISDTSRFKHKQNTLLVLGMLIACWIILWKWPRMKNRKRYSYSPIYEMEPVHDGEVR